MKLIEPVFGAEELAMLQQCLDLGWVTQGPCNATTGQAA